jgi:hypothetical protein
MPTINITVPVVNYNLQLKFDKNKLDSLFSLIRLYKYKYNLLIDRVQYIQSWFYK